MTTANVRTANNQLSRLLDAASANEEVIIAKAGNSAAIEQKQEQRKLGTLAGQFRVPDDFDEPLPDAVWDAFEGR